MPREAIHERLRGCLGRPSEGLCRQASLSRRSLCLRLRGPSETPRQAPRGRSSEGFSGISSLSRPHNHRKRLSWELTELSLQGGTPRRLMAKLEQGTDVEITTTLSGGRSKHILKLTGPGRAKLVHAQGTAQALWASLQQ